MAQAAQTETRKLAAIMFTDIVGFSRQMGADEARMLRLLEVHNHLIRQAVSDHHGTVIKTIGDAFLVDFPSVVHAVQCAQQIQAQFRAHNAEQEPSDQIHVRIGIHSGDIVQKDGDVFGEGVNIAARLQALAEPDAICISQVVYQEVAHKLALGTVVSMGQPKLKNIAQRFPVYALLSEPPTGVRQTFRVQRLKLARRVRPLGFVLVSVVFLGGVVVFLYPSLLPFRTPNSELRTDAAPAALPLPDKPSIVVLPFTNMSEDPDQEYFSDGITEDLTTDLSRLSGLFVISRNSAFTYKGKAVNVQDVSKEMGVRYVLEGSVRRANDHVRITAQLVEGMTGGHLWSERYDRPLKDIFALQDEIVRQIIANLRVEVQEAELERVRRIPTENLNAYDFGLRGMDALTRAIRETNREAQARARQMFEKSIELDSQHARAYALLGLTYWLDRFYLWNPTPQVLEQQSELARRAIALDPALPIAHVVLGWAYLFKRQHEQAIAEVEQAIALDPNSAESYSHLANFLVWAGRPEEAIGWAEKAMRLNPRCGLPCLMNLGWAYREAGQYEKALVPLKQALSLAPNGLPPHWHLAVCYAELGRKEEAQAEAAEILRIYPQFSVEAWRAVSSYKDPAMLEREVAALRKAGLK